MTQVRDVIAATACAIYRKWCCHMTVALPLLLAAIQAPSHGWMADDPASHHIGCYRDVLPASSMSETSFPDNGFSVTQCLSYCMLQRRTFAGLQNAGVCHCSDSYGQYGASASCNKACMADKQYTCGGVLASSIYTSCPLGTFGKECVFQCHCRDNGICDLKTGRCPYGCAEGWDGKHCHLAVGGNRQYVTATQPTDHDFRSVSSGYNDTQTGNASVSKDISATPEVATVSPPEADKVYRPGMTFDEWRDANYDLTLRSQIIGYSALAVNAVAILALLLFAWVRHRRRGRPSAREQNGNATKPEIASPRVYYDYQRGARAKDDISL